MTHIGQKFAFGQRGFFSGPALTLGLFFFPTGRDILKSPFYDRFAGFIFLRMCIYFRPENTGVFPLHPNLDALNIVRFAQSGNNILSIFGIFVHVLTNMADVQRHFFK